MICFERVRYGAYLGAPRELVRNAVCTGELESRPCISVALHGSNAFGRDFDTKAAGRDHDAGRLAGAYLVASRLAIVERERDGILTVRQLAPGFECAAVEEWL